MKFKRLPNQFGTISTLPGVRRKPFCAKIYVGEKVNDKTHRVSPTYKSIGTFATYREAFNALAAANQNKEAYRDSKVVTFADCFREWHLGKQKSVGSVYSKQLRYIYDMLTLLHDMKVDTITSKDVTAAIESLELTTQKRLGIIVCNGAFNQAIYDGIITVNPASNHRAEFGKTAKIQRTPITLDEVQKLYKCKNREIGDMATIQIYTGMRESEAHGLEISMIDLENSVIRGAGVKTEAGRSRVIPINDKIKPLLRELMTRAAESGLSSTLHAERRIYPQYHRFLFFDGQGWL